MPAGSVVVHMGPCRSRGVATPSMKCMCRVSVAWGVVLIIGHDNHKGVGRRRAGHSYPLMACIPAARAAASWLLAGPGARVMCRALCARTFGTAHESSARAATRSQGRQGQGQGLGQGRAQVTAPPTDPRNSRRGGGAGASSVLDVIRWALGSKSHAELLAALNDLEGSGKLGLEVVHAVLHHVRMREIWQSHSPAQLQDVAWRVVVYAVRRYPFQGFPLDGADVEAGAGASSSKSGAGAGAARTVSSSGVLPATPEGSRPAVDNNTFCLLVDALGALGASSTSIQACLPLLLTAGLWPCVFFVNSTLRALAAAGHPAVALETFHAMYQLDVSPHFDTYEVLGAVVVAGGITPAEFMSAVRRYNGHDLKDLHPLVRMLCLQSVLRAFAADSTRELEQLVQSMPSMGPDADYEALFATGVALMKEKVEAEPELAATLLAKLQVCQRAVRAG